MAQIEIATKYIHTGELSTETEVDVVAIIALIIIILGVEGQNWYVGYEDLLSGEEAVGEE